jgi:hypothetical protein
VPSLQKEIPAFTRAYEKYRGQGLVLFGVMTDDPSDSELGQFKGEVGLRYPVVRVDQELMHVFEYPEALPTTFVYDRAGNLRVRHRGDGDLERCSSLPQGRGGPPPPNTASAPRRAAATARPAAGPAASRAGTFATRGRPARNS